MHIACLEGGGRFLVLFSLQVIAVADYTLQHNKLNHSTTLVLLQEPRLVHVDSERILATIPEWGSQASILALNTNE